MRPEGGREGSFLFEKSRRELGVFSQLCVSQFRRPDAPWRVIIIHLKKTEVMDLGNEIVTVRHQFGSSIFAMSTFVKVVFCFAVGVGAVPWVARYRLSTKTSPQDALANVRERLIGAANALEDIWLEADALVGAFDSDAAGAAAGDDAAGAADAADANAADAGAGAVDAGDGAADAGAGAADAGADAAGATDGSEMESCESVSASRSCSRSRSPVRRIPVSPPAVVPKMGLLTWPNIAAVPIGAGSGTIPTTPPAALNSCWRCGRCGHCGAMQCRECGQHVVSSRPPLGIAMPRRIIRPPGPPPGTPGMPPAVRMAVENALRNIRSAGGGGGADPSSSSTGPYVPRE